MRRSRYTPADYVGFANQMQMRGDFQGAQQNYQWATSLKEFMDRSEQQLEEGSYEETIFSCTKALEIAVHHEELFNRRGVAKYRLGRYQEAIVDYTKAIETDSRYAVAFANRGLAKLDLKDYRGAIEDCDRGIRLDPEDADALNNRAFAKRNLQDYSGVIADSSAAIRLRRDFPNPFRHRGFAKFKLGNIQGALEDLDRAISLYPEYAKAFYDRALIRTYIGENSADISHCLENYAAAIADYEAAIEHSATGYPEAERALKEVKAAQQKKQNEEKQFREEKIRRENQQREERVRQEVQRKVQQEESALKKQFESLSLKAKQPKGNELATIWQEFMELEPKALARKDVNFFITFGNFCYESANKSTQPAQKRKLYQQALTAYEQVLSRSPFTDKIPELIDYIQEQLRPQTQVSPTSSLSTNRSAMYGAASRGATQPQTLTRADCSPEELAEIERIKEQMRAQRNAPSNG